MRVLLADDHPLFRDGLAALLRARGMTVVDQRTWAKITPNVEMGVGVDGAAVRAYIERTLRLTGE